MGVMKDKGECYRARGREQVGARSCDVRGVNYKTGDEQVRRERMKMSDWDDKLEGERTSRSVGVSRRVMWASRS